jgi:hypothetical protein
MCPHKVIHQYLYFGGCMRYKVLPPFQIVSHFGFYSYIALAMHLDKSLYINSKNYESRKTIMTYNSE